MRRPIIHCDGCRHTGAPSTAINWSPSSWLGSKVLCLPFISLLVIVSVQAALVGFGFFFVVRLATAVEVVCCGVAGQCSVMMERGL